MNRIRVSVALLAVVALAAGILALTKGDGVKRVSAEFDRTVGLFEGSDVRVMGMKVGSVERITPSGTSVRVDIVYDESVLLPADVKAVVTAPSVISDRFVQLTPGYVSGPRLASGAEISRRNTRVPVELDESLATTTDLMTRLGPRGANANGALSAFLATTADVLRGTGDDARATLQNLADLSDTLASDSPELAANLRHLARLTGTLAKRDADVRGFNQALAGVASTLGSDAADLSTLLRTLAVSLGDIATFVQANRGLLVQNVAQLKRVASALTAEREALAEILDIAPLAFTNLNETYDAQAQAVRTRANFGEVAKVLDRAVCDALVKQAGPDILPVCRQLRTLLDAGAVPR